jgi:hypothetical protein
VSNYVGWGNGYFYMYVVTKIANSPYSPPLSSWNSMLHWIVVSNYKTRRCRNPEEYNFNLSVCTEEHTDVNLLFNVSVMYNTFIYIFICLLAVYLTTVSIAKTMNYEFESISNDKLCNRLRYYTNIFLKELEKPTKSLTSNIQFSKGYFNLGPSI